jgi:predicted RNA methylase
MSAQNKRVTGKEQYYTPIETVRECMRLVDECKVGELYLEPAGGTGSFVRELERRGRVLSYDIEPKAEGIQRTENFLTEDLSHLSEVITVTNPPFGRANSLCVPFFNKCAEVSEVIGFLVPKSWRKWSVINRLDRRFHLVSDTEMLVDYDYDDSGKSKGKLRTVFQVWERRDYDREIYTAEDRGYITKCSYEEADVSLTVFGRGCGKVRRVFPSKSNTTQMFLKCNEDWVMDALGKIEYSKFYNNVAFVEALSIKEIWYLLNEYRDHQCNGLQQNPP